MISQKRDFVLRTARKVDTASGAYARRLAERHRPYNDYEWIIGVMDEITSTAHRVYGLAVRRARAERSVRSLTVPTTRLRSSLARVGRRSRK